MYVHGSLLKIEVVNEDYAIRFAREVFFCDLPLRLRWDSVVVSDDMAFVHEKDSHFHKAV